MIDSVFFVCFVLRCEFDKSFSIPVAASYICGAIKLLKLLTGLNQAGKAWKTRSLVLVALATQKTPRTIVVLVVRDSLHALLRRNNIAECIVKAIHDCEVEIKQLQELVLY